MAHETRLSLRVSMMHTAGAGQGPQGLQPGATAVQLREVQSIKGESTVSCWMSIFSEEVCCLHVPLLLNATATEGRVLCHTHLTQGSLGIH